MSKENVQEEKQGKIPHIFVILFGLMVIAYIMSFIIPQGAFEREINDAGTEVIIPGTFGFTDEGPASFFQLLLAIPNGLIETAEIVFGILMIGGMFAVIERSGLIQLGVNKLGNLFKDRALLIIPTLMIPFALFTTFSGQVELSLVYLPTILPLIIRLGYDRIIAAGIVLIATITGFAIGMTTPANLAVAQEISELPLYSGMGYRAIIFTAILLIGIYHVVRYAQKIKADPMKSYMYEEGFKEQETAEFEVMKATKRQMVGAILLLIAIGVLIYGLVEYQWYFKELSGLYIITAIIVGLVTGLNPSQIAESFVTGFKQILLGAMIVGVARGVALVLNDGSIMDTIIYGANIVIESVPASVTAVMMMVMQAGINFLIPSGSGQAMVTMPIMSGLADLSDITRQTSVLAFLMGDGFTNIIYPTSGYFMATLALAGVKWEKWVKFILPLIIIWYVVGAIFLIIAQVIAYGPF